MMSRLGLLLPLFALWAAQPSPSTITRLPGTGQTHHFSTSFGEDADYALTPPVLRANGDSTVTDVVSVLLWQQADAGEMAWERADEYCKALSLGGFRDWRLPFAHEAFSILNHNASRPALDTSVFTRSAAEYWWAAETRADDPSRVWVTNAGGGIGPHPKSETVSAGGDRPYHVRCVHSAVKVEGLFSNFSDNGDGTATDLHTGLVWQQQASEPLTSEEALAYAEHLELAGRDDWRLPNIKELVSLNDYSEATNATNQVIFPGRWGTWASTPSITFQTGYAGLVYGHDGTAAAFMRSSAQSSGQSVRLVR